MTSQSNLRARIAAGEELVALRGDIGWSKDQLAAAWGGDKFDFIWLDSQHSPYTDQQLVSFTGSAEELGIPVQLRVPHTRDAHKVGRFFDLGIKPREKVPGFARVAGNFEASEAGGKLTLQSRGAELELPKVFPDPRLTFDE